MLFRKLGVALIAVFALSAVTVCVSQAAVWHAKGVALAAGESRAVTVHKHGAANGTLSTKALGSALVLEATGVEASGGEIDQVGSGETGVAHGRGKVVLTGVTVSKPAGCKVASTLTSESVEGEVVMGNTEATKSQVYFRLKPVGEKFMSVKIEGCAAANTYPITGSLFSLLANSTETEVSAATYSASEAVQKSQSGSLSFGKEPAFVTTEAESTLTAGGNVGAWPK